MPQADELFVGKFFQLSEGKLCVCVFFGCCYLAIACFSGKNTPPSFTTNFTRWWFQIVRTKIYPPTQASTVTSTDCLYLYDACTLRVVHIILHTPPSPQTRLWDVFQRWCHAPPNQDAWWWGRWAWATAPTVRRPTSFRGSTRMLPQLPHPCMPPVAAMLHLCTAHLPVTCPVPPTACHMPCDPIPRSFSTLGVGLITCENQNLPTHTGEHSHFNRLPLPIWRVHLKGCAHHLTHKYFYIPYWGWESLTYFSDGWFQPPTRCQYFDGLDLPLTKDASHQKGRSKVWFSWESKGGTTEIRPY